MTSRDPEEVQPRHASCGRQCKRAMSRPRSHWQTCTRAETASKKVASRAGYFFARHQEREAAKPPKSWRKSFGEAASLYFTRWHALQFHIPAIVHNVFSPVQ